MVLELPDLGDKQQAVILGKWHRTVQVSELCTAVQQARQGMIWLLAQAPILHIGSSSLEAADQLMKLARSSGFKNTGMKGAGRKLLIEVCSTERLDAPLGLDGVLFCDGRYLQLLTDISNRVIERSALKLQQLEKNLRNL